MSERNLIKNRHAECTILGFGWEGYRAQYLSIVATRESIRSLWATMIQAGTMTTTVEPERNFLGPGTATKKIEMPLKGTRLIHAIIWNNSPELIAKITGIKASPSEIMMDYLYKQTQIPVLPEWADPIWRQAINDKNIETISTWGDAGEMWKIHSREWFEKEIPTMVKYEKLAWRSQ